MSSHSQPKKRSKRSKKTMYRRRLARTHISKRNATASPLLRLPAELRNTIFAYALDHDTIVLEHPVPRIRITDSRHKDAINLLYVCRQIYIETALLPYKLNRFVI
ncbi:hypothetical protein J4E81_003456 [Alternaria sp. BMP 2799]|nr:hypothetical protein J4E81_003456 [Alternaria sp. BMP 2799]